MVVAQKSFQLILASKDIVQRYAALRGSVEGNTVYLTKH